MKLWNEKFQQESLHGNTELWGVSRDPLEQIDPPTADNVVGNLDHFDRLIYQSGDEDIIHVNEPNRISV